MVSIEDQIKVHSRLSGIQMDYEEKDDVKVGKYGYLKIFGDAADLISDQVGNTIGHLVIEGMRHPLKNQLENFPKLFKLEILNSLRLTLTSSSFKKLRNISQLILRSNNIRVLPKGIFYNLSKLKFLDLSMNDIQKIEKNQFLGLQNADEVDLSGNEIKDIEPDAFKELSKLLLLNLEGNPINFLPKGLFDDFMNLELRLSGTKLSEKLRRTFTDISEYNLLN